MGDAPPSTPTYKYETVPGFFVQDDPATDAATFDYVRLMHHEHYGAYTNINLVYRKNITSAS
jgi:hypothetical protein